MSWLIEQLGFPWYAYIWPQMLIGGAITALLIIILRLIARFVHAISWWWCWGIALPIAFVAVFWDVFLLSREANRYCRADGGLHVYKTVETTWFVGDPSINYWSELGLSFVARRGREKQFRTQSRDGDSNIADINKHISHYGWKSATREAVIPGLWRSRFWTEDTRTHEKLGELIYFLIDSGWADKPLAFASSPWICGQSVPLELHEKYGEQFYLEDVIRATLIPQP